MESEHIKDPQRSKKGAITSGPRCCTRSRRRLSCCRWPGQSGHVPQSQLSLSLSLYFTLLLLQVACYIIHTSLMATCASDPCCCCRQSVFVACEQARVILATCAVSFCLHLSLPLSVAFFRAVLLSLRKQIAVLIAFLINCKCWWLPKSDNMLAVLVLFPCLPLSPFAARLPHSQVRVMFGLKLR